jgi:hypothetical protein
MHAETQFSQPQHEPVAHSAQKSKPLAHPPPGLHASAQRWLPKRHTLPAGQGSSSSHWLGVVGTQAPMQSLHPGQLEVAQLSQMLPGPQLSQKSHAGAQTLVANTQTPPGQSEWSVQPLGPVPVVAVTLVPVPVVDVDVDAVPALELEFAPPAPPGSKTTRPPHAARRSESSAEARALVCMWVPREEGAEYPPAGDGSFR